MTIMHSRHLTFANLASGLALVIALGTGTSYAATKVHLPKNSVSSKQIKDGSVANNDLKAGAVTGTTLAAGSVTGTTLAAGSVTGTTVADGSLTGADLAAGTLSGFRPRAYGVFNAAGTLVAARSSGATVSLAGGGYCVTPTAASGIDPTHTTIVATPDLSPSYALVQVADSANPTQNSNCPNGFLLLVSNYNGSSFTPSAGPVSFVIP
jgi:hypothetical protein